MISYNEMTTGELETLIKNASIELDKRKNAEKEEAWNKITNTIDAYLEKYGSMCVSTERCTIMIRKGRYKSRVGEIECIEEE